MACQICRPNPCIQHELNPSHGCTLCSTSSFKQWCCYWCTPKLVMACVWVVMMHAWAQLHHAVSVLTAQRPQSPVLSHMTRPIVDFTPGFAAGYCVGMISPQGQPTQDARRNRNIPGKLPSHGVTCPMWGYITYALAYAPVY